MSIRYRPPPKRLVGWRYAVFIGSIVGSIALAAYPVIISPMINPDYYSKYFQARFILSVLNLKEKGITNNALLELPIRSWLWFCRTT